MGSAVRWESNADIAKAEREAQKEEQRQQEPAPRGLSAIVERVYQRNKRFREQTGVEEQIIENLRDAKSEYAPDKLAKMASTGQVNVFASVAATKCNGAESWLSDLIGSGDRIRNFDLDPTPIPDLPPEVEQEIVSGVMAEYQSLLQDGIKLSPEMIQDRASEYRRRTDRKLMAEAKRRANKMATKIQDQFIEGGFFEAMEEMLPDFTTAKCGILKGPILRRKKTRQWAKNGLNGQTRMVIKDALVWTWQRVSALDFYHSPGMVQAYDGDTIEIVRFLPSNLEEMKGVPGFIDTAIDLVLQRFGSTGYRDESRNLDSDRARLEDRGSDHYMDDDLIWGKEFWGRVMGHVLIEEGMVEDENGDAISPLKTYEVCCIKIGPYIIHRSMNPDPIGMRPYLKSGWRYIPGSFYFRGIPELIKDLTKICNAAVRSVVRNLGIASGPQVVINDINRLAKGQNVTNMHPWKIWQFANYSVSQQKAIDFFQPNSNAAELIAVFEKFMALADDWTGIPAYTYGSDAAAGAGRTARGLSMLMSSASRGIKRVATRLDREIVEQAIMRMFIQNMRYDPDESIKGDVQIHPRGIMALIMKEQMAQDRMQFLAQTANPLDTQIMGLKGRANTLRAAAISLQMPEGDVVPSEEDIEKLEQTLAEQAKAQATGQPGGAGAPPQESATGLPAMPPQGEAP
jgi:hypothetical protein